MQEHNRCTRGSGSMYWPYCQGSGWALASVLKGVEQTPTRSEHSAAARSTMCPGKQNAQHCHDDVPRGLCAVNESLIKT